MGGAPTLRLSLLSLGSSVETTTSEPVGPPGSHHQKRYARGARTSHATRPVVAHSLDLWPTVAAPRAPLIAPPDPTRPRDGGCVPMSCVYVCLSVVIRRVRRGGRRRCASPSSLWAAPSKRPLLNRSDPPGPTIRSGMLAERGPVTQLGQSSRTRSICGRQSLLREHLSSRHAAVSSRPLGRPAPGQHLGPLSPLPGRRRLAASCHASTVALEW